MAPRRYLPILTCVLIVQVWQSDAVRAQSGEQLPLIDAIERFQETWSVDVSSAASDLMDRFSHWPEPIARTPQQHLEQLLLGTGITFFRLESGTFVLRLIEAEDQASLTGTVTSAETGGPLRDVHVYVSGSRPRIGTTTDSSGQFDLGGLNPDSAQIVFSHIAHAPQIESVVLKARSTTTVSVAMNEWVLTELPPVEIVSTAIREVLPNLRILTSDTRTTELLSEIAGIGTSDLIHNLDDVPGLYVDQNTSGVYIQGSGLGEHHFQLDGNSVFEPVHLGLVGAFNPFAIGRLTVRKAGFDASQGSFLAGVIQAEHNVVADANSSPVEVQIDPLSFNTRLHSRLELSRASLNLMGAFRTSTWGSMWSDIRSPSVDRLLLSWNSPDIFLLRASLYPLKRVFPQTYDRYVGLLADVPPPALPDIGFNDLHIAAEMNLNRGSSVKISWYRGSNYLRGRFPIADQIADSLIATPPERHDWMNENFRISWTYPLGARTTLTGTWRRARYDLKHFYGGLDRRNSVTAAFNIVRYDVIPTSDENQIQDNTIGVTLSHEYPFGALNVGLERKYAPHRFAVLHVLPRVLEHERKSMHTSSIVQKLYRPFPWLELTGGYRFTWLHSQRKLYSEPRFAAEMRTRYRGGYGASLRLATGRYYQFMNQFEIGTISPSTIVPSTRLWLPVDETLLAPKAIHYSLDFSSQLWTYWALRVEYYFKDQQRLYRIDYPLLWRQDRTTGTISTISEFVSLTHGKAYGASVDFGAETDLIGFGLRYEYSISEREYAFRNGERRTVPVPWNVPRQVHIRFRINPVRPIELSAQWRSNLGRLWAYRRAYYDLLGTDVSQGLTFDDFDFRDPTAPGHELGGFQQLDLGIGASLEFRNGARVQFRLDVLNALNRANPAYLYLREPSVIEDQQRQLVSEARYLLERTHSLSMRLSW